MTQTAILGIIIFALMIIMVLFGFPVYLSIMGCALVGLYIVGNEQIVLTQFTDGIMTLSANYTFSVIPLFMIVGILAGDTGIAAGAFTSMQAWLSRRKGGLLYATVAANAVFGACSGVSSAGTVVFCKIAAPELKKKGYDESLSMGCIAAAGCLSSLIPPSIGILTFCLMTDLSIGTALVCGTAGGLLMILIMFIVIKATTLLKPEKVPPITDADRSITWMDRIRTLTLLVPIVALFALIVGGSFFGWFPATVGGAIAAVVITIYALANRMPFKKVAACFWEGTQMFAGVYLVILGGQLFGRFITLSRLADSVVNVIAASGFPPAAVFLLILLFYAFCGCVMDCMSIIMITVPVIFPLLTGLGFNGFVICVILIFMAELGAITPPMGMAVFTVSNVLRESPTKIFKGVLPFIIALAAAAVSCVFFPQLILWLPRLMGSSGV